MQDEKTLTLLKRVMRIVGVMVVVFSVIFLIILVIIHAITVGLFNEDFYGFGFMIPLYVSGVNLLILGIVLDDGSFGEIAKPHYRDFCLLVCGLSVMALCVVVFSLVLPLDRFQGLRQETFNWLFGVLTVSFLVAFPSILMVWKKMEGLSPASLDPPPS